MAGKLAMGQKEILRGKLMEMVKQGKMPLKAAAIELKVSYRQGKRIYAAYQQGGDRALIHGNTGRRSNYRTDEAIRAAALEAYRERYTDFGPTFAAEKLREVEGITIGGSRLRRWLIEEGRWEGKRKRGGIPEPEGATFLFWRTNTV
jgi:transposase